MLPLHEALKCNFDAYIATINLLVETKPDIVQLQDEYGNTPLHQTLNYFI